MLNYVKTVIKTKKQSLYCDSNLTNDSPPENSIVHYLFDVFSHCESSRVFYFRNCS